jgi:hypothetical protein
VAVSAVQPDKIDRDTGTAKGGKKNGASCIIVVPRKRIDGSHWTLPSDRENDDCKEKNTGNKLSHALFHYRFQS